MYRIRKKNFGLLFFFFFKGICFLLVLFLFLFKLDVHVAIIRCIYLRALSKVHLKMTFNGIIMGLIAQVLLLATTVAIAGSSQSYNKLFSWSIS